MAAGVEHADGPLAAVTIAHLPLQMIIGGVVVPVEKRQELLQGPHGRPRRQCDGLDALALQVRQKSQHIRQQVPIIRRPLHIRTKRFQQRSQLRLQRSHLIRSHCRVS